MSLNKILHIDLKFKVHPSPYKQYLTTQFSNILVSLDHLVLFQLFERKFTELCFLIDVTEAETANLQQNNYMKIFQSFIPLRLSHPTQII